VWKRTVVTLDGTGSYDPDGDPLTYYWDFVGGMYVAVNNATSPTAWVFPLAQGTSLFRLTVDDGDDLGTSTATVSVAAWSKPPAANLTASPETARVGATIRLDGSGSGDPDGSIANYYFDFGDGSSATGPFLSQDHSYTAAGTFVATLAVTDDDGNTSSAEVIVVITANELPTADASVRPGIVGTMATAFRFDGANSTDADGTIASWDWSFGDGTTATGVQVSHTYAGKGTFAVTLAVTDNEGGTDRASLAVTVENRAPEIVSTTPARSVAVDSGAPETFTVDATDPDGDPLAYMWQVDGVAVGENTPSYEFRRYAAGTYRVNVTVSDGVAEVSYEWTVTVPPVEPPAGVGPGVWVALVVVAIVALALATIWRLRRKRVAKAREHGDDKR
jgi:PKD repeat protein